MRRRSSSDSAASGGLCSSDRLAGGLLCRYPITRTAIPADDDVMETATLPEVRRTGRLIGAEIHGLDLTREYPAETYEAVRQAWAEHGVIFFRDQYQAGVCSLGEPPQCSTPDAANAAIFKIGKAADRYTPVVESGPIFVDPSGRRHRVMRFAGLGAAGVLAACLVAVVVAMTGGPQAPFTQWAAPQAPASGPGGHAFQQAAGHSPDNNRSGSSVPGAAAGSTGLQNPGGAPGSTAPAGTGTSPSPSAGASPSATKSASPSASQSPVPTNPGGKTPPGKTKSPSPRKPSNAA
jgi:hypothetical protein